MGMTDQRVAESLRWLERIGTRRNRDGMARYGIVAPKAFGVGVAPLRARARRLGPDHGLALALWETGWYEARMLAVLVDDPAEVTPAQMDRWARGFDNWAITDTACFALFDRTPHAWTKIASWSRRKDEFVKRGAFALLASVALHDKAAPDAAFLRGLELIEAHAGDGRNFVKKAVNWALRAIGNRNRALNGAAIEVSRRLAASDDATARWIGKDALSELTGVVTRRRLAKREFSGPRPTPSPRRTGSARRSPRRP